MKKLILLCLASVFAFANINGAGASFPAPAYYAWMFDYNKNMNKQVNYLPTGSGGGIKSITQRIVNFGGTDEPLKADVLQKAELLMFPTLIGTIVLAYNIEGIGDNKLKLSNEALEGITTGKITKWNDKTIAKDNKGLKLPNKKITFVHRSDGSGTSFNFTYYMSLISPAFKDKIGVGKAVNWAVGIGAKGNEGVTNMIKQTPYSIGYIELAYAKKNKLARAVVKNKSGNWVEANEKNSANAAKYASWKKSEHFYQILANQQGKDTYPIVSGTFILIPKKGSAKDSKNADVIKFFDYSFKHGDKAAADLGYIPLPKETKDLIRSYWKENGL